MKSHSKNNGNNQESVRYLQRQMILLFIFFIIGGATIIFAIMTSIHCPELDKTISFIYIGFGAGLLTTSLKRIIHNRKLLKDEKALKDYFVRAFDERENYIANRAFRMAVLIVIMISYLAAFICSIFIPYIMYGLAFQVVILLISYYIAKNVYNRKM